MSNLDWKFSSIIPEACSRSVALNVSLIYTARPQPDLCSPRSWRKNTNPGICTAWLSTVESSQVSDIVNMSKSWSSMVCCIRKRCSRDFKERIFRWAILMHEFACWLTTDAVDWFSSGSYPGREFCFCFESRPGWGWTSLLRMICIITGLKLLIPLGK